jgi:hypothetical protein
MKRFYLITLTLLLVLAFQASGYFPVSKVMPLDRYRSLKHYEHYEPACTLNLDLNAHGASGYMDVYFTASTEKYGPNDSLEIYSVLCLPREFSIDSMILWVYGEPEPAQLISVGQAEATYNDIVYVTRKDPAYIRRIRGYPDNYGEFPYRPYENQYELKIFPCFEGGTRHVRIFVDCHGDLSTGLKSFNLGYPLNTVIRINTLKNNAQIPNINTGALSVLADQNFITYQITGCDANQLNLSLSPAAQTGKGYSGIIQTTDADMNYFKLNIDLNKMFKLDSVGLNRKVTLVWVPSRSTKTSAVNYYEEEKNCLAEYLLGFKTQEYLNIVYAGDQVEMFEPHMVAANGHTLKRAMNFLDTRTDPDYRSLYRQSFQALVKAFGSIASSDVPAVVFCMDREPEQSGGGYVNWARIDSMKNVLVEINVNKAKFYAWVHYSKARFYERIAGALKGSLNYYTRTSASYPYYYNTVKEYDFTLIDKVFGTSPIISSPKIEFDPIFSNIVQSRQLSNYVPDRRRVRHCQWKAVPVQLHRHKSWL